MFSATRHILETITRDPITERVRSIKPGEEVASMWDGLDETARSYKWAPNDSADMDEGFQESYAYTEADALEDALLFPLETNGEMADNLFRNDPSAMEVFEKETIDVRRFAADLDTDDESMDSDEDLDSTTGYDSDLAEQARKALEALEDDDEDSDWEDEELSDDNDELHNNGSNFVTAEEKDAIDRTVDVLSNQMKKSGTREPDYFLPILQNPASATEIPKAIREDPANLMQVLKNALRCQKEYDSSHMGIKADFYRHIDRQKSKGKSSQNCMSSETEE
jgi:hypothetical protein